MIELTWFPDEGTISLLLWLTAWIYKSIVNFYTRSQAEKTTWNFQMNFALEFRS